MKIFACPFCTVVMKLPETVTEEAYFKGEAHVNMECPVCKQMIYEIHFEKNQRIEVINKKEYLKELNEDYEE